MLSVYHQVVASAKIATSHRCRYHQASDEQCDGNQGLMKWRMIWRSQTYFRITMEYIWFVDRECDGNQGLMKYRMIWRCQQIFSYHNGMIFIWIFMNFILRNILQTSYNVKKECVNLITCLDPQATLHIFKNCQQKPECDFWMENVTETKAWWNREWFEGLTKYFLIATVWFFDLYVWVLDRECDGNQGLMK